MSRKGLSAAPLMAALLAFSVWAPLAVAGGGGRGGYGGGGYYGGYGGYRGGYGGRYYGYGPGFGIGIGVGFYPYDYDYAPAYVYAPPTIIVAAPPAAPAVTVAAPPAPAPEDGCARLQVLVPADAEVWFDGNLTTTRGEQREFTSPPLTPGRDYQYQVRARWTDGGRVVDQTRTVAVRANARVGVNFSGPEPVPAPLPVPDGR